jgi:hypothetical protein
MGTIHIAFNWNCNDSFHSNSFRYRCNQVKRHRHFSCSSQRWFHLTWHLTRVWHVPDTAKLMKMTMGDTDSTDGLLDKLPWCCMCLVMRVWMVLNFFARTHAHFSSRFVTTCNRQTFNSPIAYMPMSTRINDNTMLTSWKTFKWRRNFFIFWGR